MRRMVGADAGLGGDGVGRVLRLEVAGGDEMKGRHGGAPVGQEDLAGQLRPSVDPVRGGDRLVALSNTRGWPEASRAKRP
jgi:hypothetical protein